jgi:hypothetical protein
MLMRLVRLAALLVALGACSSLGPPNVVRDRFDYVEAIAESWKRQTLLNVVKLRYADAPVFLDVAQILGGYSLESTVSLEVDPFDFDDSLSLGGEGTYTDRPTVTYQLLSGEQFMRSLLKPIPPSAIFFTIQAGWPADLVLRLAVESINGLDNRSGSLARQVAGEPDFYRLIELLVEAQRSGSLGLRIARSGTEPDVEDVVVFFRDRDRTDEPAAEIAEIGNLLKLDPEEREFRIVYGGVRKSSDEIAVLTRSMMQIMIELGTQIQVPDDHVAAGRTRASLLEEQPTDFDLGPLIAIRSGPSRPDRTYAAVQYRDYWYWIDEDDFASKRVFTFFLILFSFADTVEAGQLPILTVPSG